MFIYQTKSKDVCVTFDSDMPVVTPNYIFTRSGNTLLCNGQELPTIKSEALTANQLYATARPVTEPTFINLNGYKISVPEDKNGEGVFKVTGSGVLIIEGEGIVNGVGKNDWNIALWATEGGRAIINGGTYTNVGAQGKDADHFDLMYVSKGGELIINGGFFECQTPRWTLNMKNNDGGVISVRGGTFVDYNPAESYTDEKADGQPSNFVADGYRVVADKRPDGHIWYTVVPANMQ